MVRMIAQTLIEAGKHRLDVADVKQMLYGQDKHLCRYKAQAEGLYPVSYTHLDVYKRQDLDFSPSCHSPFIQDK